MRYRHNGFTLVEILIAQMILMVVLVMGYMLVRMVSSNFLTATESSQSLFAVQETVHRMTREIREAQDAEDGAYLLETTDDNELVFYSDIDQDHEAERVRYTLVNDEIVRGVIEPVGDPAIYDSGTEAVSTLIADVAMQAQSVFSYYNEVWPDPTGNPLALPNRLLDTRYITVSVRVELDQDVTKTDYQLEDGVQLRNAKTN